MRVSSTLEHLVKDYAGKVRVVYKNMLVHPDAVLEAHLGGCAAGKQGKFLAYKDAFWDKGFNAYAAAKDPSKLGGANLREIAKSVGLDLPKWEADLKSDACRQELGADMAELNKFGVHATPSFFVNGKFIGGALPEDQFKKVIDERLAVAEASGVPGAEYYQKEILDKGEKKFRSKKDPKPQ
ncbi:MAG: thioredoxin domain-containing protein [Kofleriaceae bacterium]|nr:thioredoxin domain-containing protein [Kofleriaceae bacterium]MCB9574477.1 thioredoxin domain-containing protein [Kofleriaceae bacterium]